MKTPGYKAPKYDLIVGTTEHNAVSIAHGPFERISQKLRRVRRADRGGKLYVEMVRVKAGPGVPVLTG